MASLETLEGTPSRTRRCDPKDDGVVDAAEDSISRTVALLVGDMRNS